MDVNSRRKKDDRPAGANDPPPESMIHVFAWSNSSVPKFAMAYFGLLFFKAVGLRCVGPGAIACLLSQPFPRIVVVVIFLAAFGNETDTVPPLLAIVTGADADNTGGTSLGFVNRLQLMKQ